MGDMADFFLQSEEAHGHPFDYDDRDEGSYYRYKTTKSLECKYCHSQGVKWGKVEGRWRLFTGNDLHKCLLMPTLKD